MDFCFITPSHLQANLWFRDDEDYKVEMNYAAITAYALHADILAFVLMSNHVHFVLSEGEVKARQFICDFKQRYSRYFSHKYKVKELLRSNDVDIQQVSPDNLSLERAIAYTLMNPVAANICLTAGDYRWGSGGAYFSQTPIVGTPADDLSARGRKKLLHSSLEIPPRAVVLNDGFIAPSSFVNVSFVETLFRKPLRLSYFLQNSSKAKRILEKNEMLLPVFQDQVLLDAMRDICQSVYSVRSIAQLAPNQKVELVKQLKRRFSADVGQLSRVTGVKVDDVEKMLDTI